MFERLKRLFDTGKLDEVGIQNAVLKGWISAEQAQEIISPTVEKSEE